MATSWEKTFATLWTNYVPNARPSYAELTVYTRYLRKLQKKKKNKVKLLILGSTPEFRDWGFREGMEVTVVDYNKDNYNVLGEYRMHKNAKECFVKSDWQTMQFNEAFDLIIGDHIIGVLSKNDVPQVLQNIARALKKSGFFITKLYVRKEKRKSMKEIFSKYQTRFPHYNVQLMTFNDIVSSFTNPKTNIFVFSNAFKGIKQLYREKKIAKEIFNIFRKLGWERMKFNLYVPTKAALEAMFRPFFRMHKIDYVNDIQAAKIPLYILRKK